MRKGEVQESRKDMKQNRILYEDQDIIVWHKPAGIATQTSRAGQADMVSETVNYLVHMQRGSVSGEGGGGGWRNEKAQKIPYVGVIHRLDQPVEGILVFAKNRSAAAGLSRQITEEQTEKYYYAVVCGRTYKKDGTLEDYLLKDGRTNTSSIVPSEIKGARRAVLHYEILSEKMMESGTGVERREEESCEDSEAFAAYKIALARIRLYTGRHHQIRVQMSSAGMSLLGDYKYADAETIRISEHMQIKDIALCAYWLSFMHPGTGKRMEFQIRPEGRSFRRIEEFASYY